MSSLASEEHNRILFSAVFRTQSPPHAMTPDGEEASMGGTQVQVQCLH